MNCFLGVDVSTTGSKALVIDENGTLVTTHTVAHPSSAPHALWSEQNPRDWWSGVVEAIRIVLAHKDVRSQIRAVGLTGQMHGLVCLNQEKSVIRPAILWNDQRTAEECIEIENGIGLDKLLSLTGNRALTGFTAPKLLWMKKHEPEAFAKIHHILLPKDYLRFMLTNEFATDLADASGTLLLDVKNRSWSSELIRFLELDPAWLPKLCEGPQVTGQITAGAAQGTGLTAGIPVVAGGGDQAAQAVGVGAILPGINALTIGTSGVVFAPLSAYAFEPQGRLHAFCHAVPETWHLMGVMLSAAGSLSWFRDTLQPQATFEELSKAAETSPPGAKGLVFLPYLNGERTPHPDPLARGCFIGLTQRHTKGDMVRAIMEGVAFGLRDSLELLSTFSPEIKRGEFRVSGGASKSKVWLQILADILEVELSLVTSHEGAAFGAAILAGVGEGFWRDIETASNAAVKIKSKTQTSPLVKEYSARYEIYRELYPKLQDVFQRLY